MGRPRLAVNGGLDISFRHHQMQISSPLMISSPRPQLTSTRLGRHAISQVQCSTHGSNSNQLDLADLRARLDPPSPCLMMMTKARTGHWRLLILVLLGWMGQYLYGGLCHKRQRSRANMIIAFHINDVCLKMQLNHVHFLVSTNP